MTVRVLLEWLSAKPGMRTLLKEWRNSEQLSVNNEPVEVSVLEPVRDPETGHKISSDLAATLCIKPRNKLSVSRSPRQYRRCSKGRKYRPWHDVR